MLPALLFAFALVQDPGHWVPARWPFANPETLSLLDDSPVNCLVLDKAQWNAPLVKAAHARGLTVLAAVAGDGDPKPALSAHVDGIVVEGDAPPERLKAWRGMTKHFVYLPDRARILADGAAGAVVGTAQGLWPGIHADKEDATKAGPTSAPWIDTNFGFLEFLRAAAPAGKTLWIANRSPEKPFGAERYLQAWADAALAGARWVISFDPDFAGRLARKEDKALAGWRRMNGVLRFYNEHWDLCELPDHALLAIVQDAASGGLLSGSFVDMVASRHIPALVLPPGKLGATAMPDVDMILNTDPAGLSPEQKEKVMSVARKGGTVVNGPPAWKLSMPAGDAITFDAAQYRKLDDILREVNQVIGRKNMGVRVFNAPGTLSSLRATPDGKKLVLHLVNYTSYPIESVTAEVLGKYTSATLLTPQGNKTLKPYETDDGTGVEIERLDDVAIVVFE